MLSQEEASLATQALEINKLNTAEKVSGATGLKKCSGCSAGVVRLDEGRSVLDVFYAATAAGRKGSQSFMQTHVTCSSSFFFFLSRSSPSMSFWPPNLQVRSYLGLWFCESLLREVEMVEVCLMVLQCGYRRKVSGSAGHHVTLSYSVRSVSSRYDI